MLSIVQKVQNDLCNLAKAEAASGSQNVTLNLVSDFKLALFAVLPEEIRIQDLKESDELKEEMTSIFQNEEVKLPGWPYLDQLENQLACFAEKGCKFQLGSELHKSSTCPEHFLCRKHKSSPCNAKHKKEEDKNQGEKTTEGRKNKSPPRQSEAENQESPGPRQGKVEGKAKEDVKDSNHDKIEKKQGVLTSKRGDKPRAVKLQVADIAGLSVEDFEFKKGDCVSDVQIFQVQTKQGELIWVLENDYIQLKEKSANLKAINDSDEEEVVNGEDTNRQNADVGK
jgi:hypothetical protein